MRRKRRREPPDYREVRIPKGNGKFRSIIVPSKSIRAYLRTGLTRLSAIAMALDSQAVSHGFTYGRNAATCAAAHIGFAFTVSFDLSNCFDNVKHAQIKAMGIDIPPDCFYRGIARQGLPTSPALANIALSPLDGEIMLKLAGRGVYTRYADDLTISTNDTQVIREFTSDLPAMVVRHGHTINRAKTCVQSAQGGRRIIVGIAVDADGIYATRKAKRRLRAAKHQKNRKQARGLSEWIKLKPPNWIKRASALLSETDSDSHLLARMIANRHN